jgi:uridine kinase
MYTSIGLTPTLIGLSGGSGSGKTTLATAVHERLGSPRSAVLSLDSYYKDLSHFPLEERAGVNFDHPDALDVQLLTQQIRQLRCGKAVGVPCYDFTTHSRQPETRTLQPKTVVLVEGILLLALDPIRSLLDLQISVSSVGWYGTFGSVDALWIRASSNIMPRRALCTLLGLNRVKCLQMWLFRVRRRLTPLQRFSLSVSNICKRYLPINKTPQS